MRDKERQGDGKGVRERDKERARYEVQSLYCLTSALCWPPELGYCL